MATAACAVGPNFRKPGAPAGAGYLQAGLPGATQSASLPGGDAQRFLLGADVSFKWWESFRNPALNALVEKALRRNPTIPAAQAALRQAQEMVDAQRGYFFPTVSASYQFQRQQIAGNVAASTAPGVQGNGQVIQPKGPGQPLTYNFHTAELTVGYNPDVFGGNRRRVESLAAQARMQRFVLEATYVSLAANVVAAAIQEASVRAQIAATQEIIDYNKESLAILHEKFGDGYAMRLDVALIEAQLAQAEALLPPLNSQLAVTRDLLRALSGGLPNERLDGTFALNDLTLPTDIPVTLPSRLIERRPDVRAAEEQIRSQNAQVGAALSDMLPQFSIDGTAGGQAAQFADMFSHGGPFWSLAGSAAQTLFDGGTLLHTKRAAEQALEQAAFQYRGTVLTAYQNVADSLHALISDAETLQKTRAAERAARVAADVTQEQMRDGFTDLLSDLAAEITYQQAVISLAQARASRFGDTVALFQAVGGGWWHRAPETLASAN